ncbi:MAG: trypsin-like peptidase domain-containing protein, partial [Gemmataceae bacterium]
LLTSYHVVKEATKIYVRLPGGKGSYVDIHAADPRSDLAILRVLDNSILPLKPIAITQDNKFRKGQMVLSIANPYAAGYRDGSPSASWGIISNLRRRDPGKSLWEQDRADWTIHDFGTMLQADARLNLGCSGGALINLKGELIGVTTALAAISGSETAGGYAIPLDESVRAILNELIEGKEVAYGFLGVGFGSDERQVEVNVLEGSAAARGGLSSGDVILSVNGHPIRHSEDLFLNVGMQLAGTQAKIEVRTRQGVHRTLTVALDKFHVPGPIIASQKPAAVRGMRVEYGSIWCQRFSKQKVPDGVYVSEVIPGSAADQARLQDHFITRVNGKPVHNPADFYREAGKRGGPLTLTVRRSELDEYRTVRLD